MSTAATAPAGVGHLKINLSFDAQASAAPQSFRDGIQTAANLLDAAIYDNITVNIVVGYGEDRGTVLTNGSAEGGPSSEVSETYSVLRSQLANAETSQADVTAVNSLPNTTSLNGRSRFFVTTAEEKALGIIAATATAIDGYVGFAADIASNLLVGVALHEITHAMGRIDGASVLSLFRFSAPGSRVFTSGPPASSSYFSVDGGVTDLADFGTSSDPSDLLSPPAGNRTPNDPFNEFYTGSTKQSLTPIDLTIMDVLGFDVTPPVPAVTIALQVDTGSSASDRITANPALTGGGDPNAIVTVREGGNTLGTTTANGSGIWVFTPTGLGDGPHTLVASETSSGGTANASLSFTLKTAAAAPSGLALASASDTGAKGDNITSVTTPVLTGSGESGDSLVLYDGGLAIGTATVAANSGWSATSSSLTFGPHVFAAGETDVAGNISNRSATLTVQIDTPLIDQSWYYATYPDVAAAGVDAGVHYDRFGWHEGRNPDVYFNTRQYLNLYTDVAAAGVDPLQHYDQYGWKEGRNPSLAFDTDFYLAHYADIKAAGVDPLTHYLQFGINEGRTIEPAVGHRTASTDFDPDYYLMANPDVAAAGVDPYQHFLTFGWNEGRNPSAFFNTGYYLQNNPDVAQAGVDPLLHYVQYGWHEGRNPSALFNTEGYLASNPDVASASVDPLEHYLIFGINEGRLP